MEVAAMAAAGWEEADSEVVVRVAVWVAAVALAVEETSRRGQGTWALVPQVVAEAENRAVAEAVGWGRAHSIAVRSRRSRCRSHNHCIQIQVHHHRKSCLGRRIRSCWSTLAVVEAAPGVAPVIAEEVSEGKPVELVARAEVEMAAAARAVVETAVVAGEAWGEAGALGCSTVRLYRSLRPA